MAALIQLVVIVLLIVSLWKVFVKAGQPGWAAIIPLYNWYILVKIASKPWWWFLLLFIPLVNIVIVFLVFLAIAGNFGKGTGFAVGLFFLGFIFFPILAFSDAQYSEVAQVSSV